ncbi:MAG: hypothetical protein Ct9H300mP15_01540 [Gemmatimonadota bacterium]|nr:MAG: hypothetical protein Ct9H300mP15_01540 [Gemmatimonadota bacterium]
MGRQLTLEDYYQIKSVGSPLISPSGDWITFTVSQRIEETNGTTTESWVVRSDGSGMPVKVLHNGQNVSNPRWTDDGHLSSVTKTPSGLLILNNLKGLQ